MGEMLQVLLPYLNSDSVFTAPVISNPVIDDDYIQKVSSEIRRRFGLNSKEITFSEIMNLYPVWDVFEEFTLIHRMRWTKTR